MRFWQLEKKILYVIRAFGRRAFWCDSHPLLCIHCKRLRELIKYRKMSKAIIIFTKRGPYLWSSMKKTKVKKVLLKIG